jgi:hypothetical protein
VECENDTRCPIKAANEVILESPPQYKPSTGVHVWELVGDAVVCSICGVASHSSYSSRCEALTK